MPKDTKKNATKPEKVKKANPALEDDTDLEDEEETDTETDETEETETDEADADEETEDEDDEEEVEEKPTKPAKGSKAGKTEAVKKPLGRADIATEMKKDVDTIKEALAKQPKVRMFIPLGIGEKKGGKGAFESVTINGYRQVFPKGEYITVPESVALILEEHYNMSSENTEAGEAFRLDRPRHKDGMSTDEALG